MKINKRENKMRVKTRNRIILLIIIILIISTTIIGISKVNKNNQNKIELIQLSSQGPRQMMGYILRTKNNKVILIDGGTKDDTQNLKNYLKENNNKVDYWFLTHAHDDHVGAFLEIVNENEVKIEHIYASLNTETWYEKNEENRAEFSKQLINTINKKEQFYEPKLNETLKIDGIKVEILGVKNPEIMQNAGNEQSMVIKFDFEKESLLILGDTGKNSSKKLLTNQRNKLKSTIVQMAHHGQNGATKELYEVIKPTICLWPTPEWLWKNETEKGENTGPFKTFETRKWMEELNVNTHYIAKDGDLKLKIN